MNPQGSPRRVSRTTELRLPSSANRLAVILEQNEDDSTPKSHTEDHPRNKSHEGGTIEASSSTPPLRLPKRRHLRQTSPGESKQTIFEPNLLSLPTTQAKNDIVRYSAPQASIENGLQCSIAGERASLSVARSSLLKTAVSLRFSQTAMSLNDNTNTERFRKELLRDIDDFAHLEHPDARIVMVGPKEVQLQGQDCVAAKVLPYGFILKVIAQTPKLVYYDMRLTVTEPSSDSRNRAAPRLIHCRIYYIPSEDSCLFEAISGQVILTAVAQTIEVTVFSPIRIELALWALSIRSTEPGQLVAHFLREKRAYKLTIFERTSQPHLEIVPLESGSLADLRYGATARLIAGGSSLTSGNTFYEITHTGDTRRNGSEITFAGFHSRLNPAETLVKVLVVHSGDSTQAAAKTWQNEYSILSQLVHDNIVKMRGFDARKYAFYLELPPHALTRHAEFPRATQMAILYHIANALPCMDSKGYMHQNVQLETIHDSNQRGAALSNFGSAASAHGAHKTEGGSLWYRPPEFHLHQQRGHQGDIWALGVVMLTIMGKSVKM
ncbi:hypothetical protein NLG97_g1885 [Lecanicillium saksenae]|uniref:Uncharacterized protein n=1 Tax=Lecanicillium saksenae TaxID=468837 RepID=A0ACC1R556_9HYPO|nr:hypothetical protein NLG97_g1885 [Lecanicillium saksenae]